MSKRRITKGIKQALPQQLEPNPQENLLGYLKLLIELDRASIARRNIPTN